MINVPKRTVDAPKTAKTVRFAKPTSAPLVPMIKSVVSDKFAKRVYARQAAATTRDVAQARCVTHPLRPVRDVSNAVIAKVDSFANKALAPPVATIKAVRPEICV